ncbi:MAG TPA: glycosyltransferase family 2 protein [Xanthomonadales bacterium]|nr:glycosyltransferase family 2 protein [Xanthomonadales bacterium]
MTKKVPELSIFFPFWDEQDNIENVVRPAISVVEKYAEKWEIIMVDDGSADDTLQIAKRLASEDPRLKVVSHKPNRGYGAALRGGFQSATYDLVAFTDGDGQFDISEIEKFLDKITEADIVIGFRKKRSDKNLGKRLLLMNLLKIWDLLLFRFYFRDIDCGFKMFRRDAINKISPLRSEGAMITTEILAKAKRKKLRIKEVGVTHYPRIKGHQSGANFPVIVRAVLESFILWYDLHYGRT